jgi:hypothetical protein
MDNLIERYISAVRDALPAKQRQDVTTEIRSLIQDALDDRSKTEGRPVDDEMTAQVLKEFGPPEKIAAPYLPERYLIGPRLYPTFILVLKIALPIIAVLVLVTSFIGTEQLSSMSASEFITQVAKALGNSFSSVIAAFGNIVLIFAILQVTLPEFKLQTREWDPRNLKAISQPDKIKRGDVIVELVFTLLALIIFNFYLDKVGIYNNLNGQWFFTPVLTAAFNAYIPWFDLLWILTIVLDLILLSRNSWNTLTRLFSIFLSGINIAIAVSLLSNIKNVYTLEGVLSIFGGTDFVKSVLDQVIYIVFVIVIIAEPSR